jgi:hypothetical protein
MEEYSRFGEYHHPYIRDDKYKIGVPYRSMRWRSEWWSVGGGGSTSAQFKEMLAQAGSDTQSPVLAALQMWLTQPEDDGKIFLRIVVTLHQTKRSRIPLHQSMINP